MKKSALRMNKLVDARNIEGEKNEKVFEITRRIERELSQFPEFIGVFPFGSRTKGYADENIIEPKSGMKGSDYDFYIFEDKNLKEGDRVFDALCLVGMEYRKIGIKIQFLGQFLSMENLRGVIEMVDSVSLEYLYVQCFSNLLRIGRGKKIDYWRNKTKEEILKLPKEVQEKLLQLFSDYLVLSDKRSVSKITERIADFNADEYLKVRKELWVKRVHKIFSE